jgi:5'-3' exonuclease
LIEVDKAEADDIIAVLSRNTKEQVIIISSDKDFIQLKLENVSIYDPIKKIFKEAVDIERYKTLHYMVGDKSDNILAIKARMGDKTAEKCIHQLDEMLALNPEMKLRYEFNKKMIDLDAIPEEIQKNILTEWNKDVIVNYDGIQLLKFFQKYNLQDISEKHHLFRYSDNVVKTSLNEQPMKEQKMKDYITTTLDDFFGE